MKYAITAVVWLSLFIANSCFGPYGLAWAKSTAPNITVAGHFECLWWSENQMAGLNPNNPPPKTTPTRLEKWEYSDPIGVPHPDDVTLVLNLPTKVRGLVKIEYQWIGRKGSGIARAMVESTAFGETGNVIVRATIPVKRAIENLHPAKLHAVVYVSDKVISAFDLPIILGD